jgi:protein tyrosine/serine phosphatase
MVQDNLYRGGYPKPKNLPFLRRLKLKTIISLTPDPVKPYLEEFCALEKIVNHHIKVEKPKDSLTLTPSKALQVLQMLINPDNLPIYMHCLDGSIITGMVVMCLRKLQMWTMPIIIIEYTRYVSILLLI